GRRRTYKELADWTNRIAHALVEDYGVKPGNRVLVRSANNPAMVACWLAATKAGAVVVNTMPMLRAGELAQIVDKAKIRVALCAAPPTRPAPPPPSRYASRRCRPAATTWPCSPSPRAPPASRRRPCTSIATC